MAEVLHRGWHQVGFERELKQNCVPVSIGSLPLMLVRTATGIGAYDAACPHRGAHLAHGGKLQDDSIICPFHGYRIGLGAESSCELRVNGYRTHTIGGLIFVLLDEHHENGFSALLDEIDRTHFVVPGFTLVAHAPAPLVVENGFDPEHFKAVHGLKCVPKLRIVPEESGALTLESCFDAASFQNAWHAGSGESADTSIRFVARIFSPNICVSRLGEGASESLVISGATPNGDGTCTIRVSVAVRAGADGKPPSEASIRGLLRDSKVAYEQDLAIWQHIVPGAPSHLGPRDEAVLFFHRFCERFVEQGIARSGSA